MLKVILRSFGAFPVFNNLVSWKRLVVERRWQLFVPLRTSYIVYRVLLTVNCSTSVWGHSGHFRFWQNYIVISATQIPNYCYMAVKRKPKFFFYLGSDQAACHVSGPLVCLWPTVFYSDYSDVQNVAVRLWRCNLGLAVEPEGQTSVIALPQGRAHFQLSYHSLFIAKDQV